MKITIITPVYNGAGTVGDAIDSVRRQVLSGGVQLEHVVVDGASTDDTMRIVRDFADRVESDASPGYSFRWISECDRGLYDAINKGIGMATGDVVGICNADDILASDDVVSRVAAAFDRDLDATWSDVRFVGGGNGVGELRNASVRRYCTGRFFRRWMFRFATFPAHPGTFVRRSCFERYGRYRLDYPICADFELMLRLFLIHGIRARYLPMCTHVMRTGGVSTGGLKSNLEINREDLRALKANGVWSCMAIIYMKYPFKIWGCILGGLYWRGVRLKR